MGGTAGTDFAFHFRHPETVVLASPVLVDLAGAHGIEGALHTQRADIDVRHNDGYQHDGNKDWMGYFMRRLSERPANLLFVARNFFRR